MSTWDVLARWADDRTRRDEEYRFERQLHVLKEESKRLENERVALHQEWEYQEEVARSEWEELQAERDDLITQRDVLLAALKPFIEWVDGDAGVMFQVMGPGGGDTIDWPEDTDGNALLHKIRAAIVAVEGE